MLHAPGLYVWIMWLWLKRIPKEHQDVDLRLVQLRFVDPTAGHLEPMYRQVEASASKEPVVPVANKL
jgi:hypothetical protein